MPGANYGSADTPLVGSEDRVHAVVKEAIKEHERSHHPPILTAASEDSTETCGENEATFLWSIFYLVMIWQSAAASTIGGFFVNNKWMAGESLAPALLSFLVPFVASHSKDWGVSPLVMGLWCGVLILYIQAATLDKLNGGVRGNGIEIKKNGIEIKKNGAEIKKNGAKIDVLIEGQIAILEHLDAPQEVIDKLRSATPQA